MLVTLVACWALRSRVVAEYCTEDCSEFEENYLAWAKPGIGRPITFMFFQSLLFFGCIFFAESGFASRLWQKAMIGSVESAERRNEEELRMGDVVRPELDSDVIVERNRVLSTPLVQLEDTLIIKELKKYYNGSFLAVDGLSLGVPMGECFGLLGVNGAGKTTTFKMLTGDETISNGEAYVDTYSVIDDIKQVRERFHFYCFFLLLFLLR